MDFHASAPAAVRAFIATLLEGDLREPMGLAESLARAERELTEIDGAIATQIRQGASAWLDRLRKQRAEAAEHRDMLAGDVACLLRLANDDRMADAFARLTCEISDDQQWQNFISAAWVGRVDYLKYRVRLKRAVELQAEIGDAADNLAKLIRQFSETGIQGPGEFYSIPELMRQIDNHEMQCHNLHMWRSMRQHVLGDLPMCDVPEAIPVEKSGEPIPHFKIVFVPAGGKAEIDPEQAARDMLRYAWGTAPDFSALLVTLANAARSFKPSESGMIVAGLASRKRTAKTAYLRAFGNLLSETHGFSLSTPIMQAISIVSNVVIDLPDGDVTYDDVRKALKK